MKKSGIKPLLWSLGLLTIVHANMNDDPLLSMLKMDKLEILDNAENTIKWDGSIWIGYDLDKISLYSEGERTSDGLENSQNELLYTRAVLPYWNIQAGIAYDKNADRSRKWAEVALSGLAPYYFETKAAVLFNAEGNLGLRLDMEYELLLTQKLIATPSLEADFYTEDDPKMLLGRGLSSIEAGLRLRYEFIREFAPYVGVEWEKTFGKTYKFNPIDDLHTRFGVTFWF